MQYRLNNLFPGATMKGYEIYELEDLFKPASAGIEFSHDSWAKLEGDSLRIPAVIDWTPKGYFNLDERRFPLTFGTQREWTWKTTLELPEGYEVKHVPEDAEVKTSCLSLSRSYVIEGARLISEWRYASLCEELSPEDYQAQRQKAREMMVLLEQEVVLGKELLNAPRELKLPNEPPKPAQPSPAEGSLEPPPATKP
jgi:hypothetical protein